MELTFKPRRILVWLLSGTAIFTILGVVVQVLRYVHGYDYQLGFDVLLQSAESQNRARKIERETAHLPGTKAEGIPYYRQMLREHHAEAQSTRWRPPARRGRRIGAC